MSFLNLFKRKNEKCFAVGDKIVLKKDKNNPFRNYYYKIIDIKNGFVCYQFFMVGDERNWASPTPETLKTVQMVYTKI